ncbi:CDGSH iron-sulfur domain-containing protein [Fibrobacterota bacterium]
MIKPELCKKEPVVLDLKPGAYFWCKCTKSKIKPLCDNSHTGTGCSPLAFTIGAAKKVSLCQCQKTGNPPYCDGTHAKMVNKIVWPRF